MAKIAIDAGHGLKTAGKRCLKSLDKNETREWVLNNRVSVALADYLDRMASGRSFIRCSLCCCEYDQTLARFHLTFSPAKCIIEMLILI